MAVFTARGSSGCSLTPSSLSADGIAALVSRYTDMSVEEKHRLVCSGDRHARLEYLIGSLGWLREPRLFCAQRLLSLAAGLGRRTGADGDAQRMIAAASVLQPSAPLAGADPGDPADLKNDRPDQRILRAHQRHSLEKGVEFLHILVDRALQRTDYFASLDSGRSVPLSIDYLGTTFAPRLASSTDQNAVLPAAKLSKLRHLMRAPRMTRVVHQGALATRCSDGVFGPTIDTLLMGEVLLHVADRETGLLRRDCSVIELGVGTGHLMSLLAVTAGGRLRTLIGSDVCPKALATAQRNVKSARPKGTVPRGLHLILSDNALKLLSDASVDVVVTNPPYLPERPSQEHGTPSGSSTTATAGKEIIRQILVDDGVRVLKKDGFVLMVTSTLTKQVLTAAIEDAKALGVAWHHVRLRVLPWVPLDLPEVHENFQWVELLLSEGAEHVQFDVAASEYPLRHGVVVTAFSLSKRRIDQLAKLATRPAVG